MRLFEVKSNDEEPLIRGLFRPQSRPPRFTRRFSTRVSSLLTRSRCSKTFMRWDGWHWHPSEIVIWTPKLAPWRKQHVKLVWRMKKVAFIMAIPTGGPYLNGCIPERNLLVVNLALAELSFVSWRVVASLSEGRNLCQEYLSIGCLFGARHSYNSQNTWRSSILKGCEIHVAAPWWPRVFSNLSLQTFYQSPWFSGFTADFKGTT